MPISPKAKTAGMGLAAVLAGTALGAAVVPPETETVVVRANEDLGPNTPTVVMPVPLPPPIGEDDDGDGVPNSRDVCLHGPKKGIPVQANGCPVPNAGE